MRRALIAAALIATPAFAARIVPYPITPEALASYAAEQGVVPSEAPPPATRGIALTIAPGVDHEVIRAGLYCSAWTVENPISQLLSAMFTAHDPDGTLDPAPGDGTLAVEITRAATLSRCVGNGEMSAVCITRVTIRGSVKAGTAPARPLDIVVEKPAKSIGACAGLTRGIALISREAVVGLLAQVDTAAAN